MESFLETNMLMQAILAILLFIASIAMARVFQENRGWQSIFWVTLVLYSILPTVYGYTLYKIYPDNVDSFNSFISGSVILSVAGLLFSERRRIIFKDSLANREIIAVLVVFFVVVFVYMSAIDTRETSYYSLTTLQYYGAVGGFLSVVIYPMILMLALVMFLFKFSFSERVFTIYVACQLYDHIRHVSDDFLLGRLSLYELLSSAVAFSLYLASLIILLLSRHKYLKFGNTPE